MNIGMLWFDNDPHTELPKKVARSVAYYQTKYGQAPNLCFIHPSMIKETPVPPTQGVEVRLSRSVLPNHFWLGVNTLASATGD